MYTSFINQNNWHIEQLAQSNEILGRDVFIDFVCRSLGQDYAVQKIFLCDVISYMNHPTELREKTFRRSQKASHNFCRKLNLLFRFKLEKYLCIIVAVLPLIAKM